VRRHDVEGGRRAEVDDDDAALVPVDLRVAFVEYAKEAVAQADVRGFKADL